MSRTCTSTSCTRVLQFGAVPLELLQRALLADPFDDEPDRARLGTLRRVRGVARQHPHLAFVDVDPAGAVLGHHVDVHVALDLVEELLVGVDVIVGARGWARRQSSR